MTATPHLQPRAWLQDHEWAFDRIGLTRAHERATGSGVEIHITDDLRHPNPTVHHVERVADVLTRVAPAATQTRYDIGDGAGNQSGAELLRWLGSWLGAGRRRRRIACMPVQVYPHTDYVDLAWHLKQAGWLLIASAGNHGTAFTPGPAHCPDVLSVGAVDQTGEVPWWSSKGRVTLYAPGVDVHVHDAETGESLQLGTSFSAPIVAGVAALVWQLHPEWGPADVWAHLVGTSESNVVSAWRAVEVN